MVTEPNGGTTLLNESGGRSAAIWTGNATAGQRIGQWVDNSATGSWNRVKTSDGFYKLQSVKNTNLYLTGASDGAPLILQNAVEDGSQEWELVPCHPAGLARPAPGWFSTAGRYSFSCSGRSVARVTWPGARQRP